MNHGYVKFWRKALDAGWLKNHELWVFWSYCLLKASHKKYTVIVGCQRVDLLLGQFVMGRRKASEETGLTEREIRTCLALLIKWENVTSRTTNKFTVITVINWDAYQSNETANDQHNDQQATSGRPHTNTEEHKKEPPRDFSSEISALENRYPDRETIKRVFDAIISTRKSNRIADTVRLSILKAWERYPVESVTAGIKTFLEKGYQDQGKDEKYLLGIIRKNGNGQRTGSEITGTKKAETVPPPSPLKCPRCGRELVVKNDLYGDGCIYCQRALEARA